MLLQTSKLWSTVVVRQKKKKGKTNAASDQLHFSWTGLRQRVGWRTPPPLPPSSVPCYVGEDCISLGWSRKGYKNTPVAGYPRGCATSPSAFRNYYTHYLPSRIAKVHGFIINLGETNASVRSRKGGREGHSDDGGGEFLNSPSGSRTLPFSRILRHIYIHTCIHT